MSEDAFFTSCENFKLSQLNTLQGSDTENGRGHELQKCQLSSEGNGFIETTLLSRISIYVPVNHFVEV